jgi:hypothetical protein
MHYQLPNGRVIEMSTEQYFEMSDEELEYLIAFNYGDLIENPWHGSILNKIDLTEDDVKIFKDLTDIPELEKLSDLDIDFEVDD